MRVIDACIAAVLAAGTLALCLPAQAEPADDCLLESLRTAPDNTTVAELKARCQSPAAAAATVPATVTTGADSTSGGPSAIQQRLAEDFSLAERDYLLSTYHPTYLLPFAYNSKPNQQPFTDIDPDAAELDDTEVEFQISFKFPLARGLWGNNDLLAAFTAQSWWQFYNDDDEVSSAFRETNYEPEVFLRHYGGPEFLGGKVAGFDIGLNHESNGRGEQLSRSWNRVMGRAYLDYGDLAFAVRGWYRIPEDEEDDDNPHMHRYYGYGDVRAIWAPNKNTFTAMLRPGTEKTSYELTWSYPITEVLRLYTLYYSGYGESLLDYNQRVERIGIGIAISDYLIR